MKKVLAMGIDVSDWQENINFKKAVNAGVEFVIIRSSYGWKSDTQKDKKFDEHIKGFKALKIPCGIYHYSYATTKEEAILEAEFCLKCIGSYKPELPIYYDMEEASQASLGKAKCTEIAIAFCEAIEKAGLKAGVYANANWFENHIDYDKISKSYSIWLAQWSDKPSFDSAIWQYTSTGKVDGIQGHVDMNYMPVDSFQESPKDNEDNTITVKSVKLINTKLYVSSTAKEASGTISGSYWLWSDEQVNNRVRITNNQKNIGINGQVTGWINVTDIKNKKSITHIVKAGDTLWGIAEKYFNNGMEYKKIMSLNNLKSEVIYIGQKLKIPK